MKRLHIFTVFFIFSLLCSISFAQVSGTTIKGQMPNGTFDWIQLDASKNLKTSGSGGTSSSSIILPNNFQYYQYTSSETVKTLTTPTGTVGVSIQVLTPGGSVKWKLATSTMTINEGELVTWYSEEVLDAGIPIAIISSNTSSIYVIKFKRRI